MKQEGGVMSMSMNQTYKKILSIDIGIKNLALSLIECKFVPPYDQWSAVNILEIELVDIVQESQRGKKVRQGAKPKNAKTVNINVLCNALVQILIQRKSWIDNITDIRVEQQPLKFGGGGFGGKNKGKFSGGGGSSRMKVIQHCILTFYETYFAIHADLNKPLIQPSSPGNKLKCIIDENDFAIHPLGSTAKDTEYVQRKNKAEEDFEKVMTLCTMKESIKTMYDGKKKQDDMADCVLQAIFELQTWACKLKDDAKKSVLKKNGTKSRAGDNRSGKRKKGMKEFKEVKEVKELRGHQIDDDGDEFIENKKCSGVNCNGSGSGDDDGDGDGDGNLKRKRM
jgi:hypothetical protein